MTNNLSDIEKKIQSDDEDVLRGLLEFAYRCRQREFDRGRTAETRATATLAMLGVVVGLIVSQGDGLPEVDGNNFWFLAISYLIPLCFLLRGVIYALRVLGAAQGLRVEVDAVYDFQQKKLIGALRSEIAAVIWECRNAIAPNSHKLWCLDRCQRNGLLGLVSLFLFGVALALIDKLPVEVPLCVTVLYGILASLTMLFEGKYFQKIQWSWQ